MKATTLAVSSNCATSTEPLLPLSCAQTWTGVVTSLILPNYGIVDGDAFYVDAVVQGRLPKVRRASDSKCQFLLLLWLVVLFNKCTCCGAGKVSTRQVQSSLYFIRCGKWEGSQTIGALQ